MRWLIYVAGVVALVGIAVIVIGAMLPRKHSVSRTARVPLAPDALYAILSDVSRYPSWRPELKSLQRLPDRNGLPAWIEETGGMKIPMTFDVMQPRFLVARIDTADLPFGGTWSYRIEALPAGE